MLRNMIARLTQGLNCPQLFTVSRSARIRNDPLQLIQTLGPHCSLSIGKAFKVVIHKLGPQVTLSCLFSLPNPLLIRCYLPGNQQCVRQG